MTNKDDELDILFNAARGSTVAPSNDLLGRIMADADAAMPNAHTAPKITATKSGIFATLWSAIGGWPAAVGMAAATLAGVWIGFSQPAGLDLLTESYLGINSDYSILASGFSAEMWEG